MRKHIAMGASAALLAAAVAVGPAAAAPHGQGADKKSLVGPYASLYCADLAPTPSETVTGEPVGFVVFNKVGNNVKAQVVLKGGAPNVTHRVRIIQANANGSTDCHEIDAVVKTNKKGHATINLSEPITGDVAQVIVDSREVRPVLSIRATEAYKLN